MATITVIVTECDMPHADDKTPAQTFTLFSKSVGEYTVDLCEKCAHKVLTPVMASGRQTAKPKRSHHK